MEVLPQVQAVCTRAIRIIFDRLEDIVASDSDLAVIRLVLSPGVLNDVVDERFAQSRCGYLKCGNGVDKQRAAKSSVKFNESKGDFEPVLAQFCCEECSNKSEGLKKSLDPTPTYLR